MILMLLHYSSLLVCFSYCLVTNSGFVRFAHPKSVERAFERFKVSEIEVQDVSVMMKPLKPECQSNL